MINFFKNFCFALFIGILLSPSLLFAQSEINLDGQKLLPRAKVFTSPATGDFLNSSTFEVPIYIDTQGNSVNTINIKLKFDPSKLSIIKPTGGKSIFGIWIEPPSYDNKSGFASFVGVIPNGIVTSSGLIATVTFKAISVGETRVLFSDDTSSNLNDGVGSNVKLSLIGSLFNINPKIPDGVSIYSETHPDQEHWYNNSSPIFKWDTPIGIKGYSVLIDSNPGSIPPTEINSTNASIFYENLKDGIWYLHVRANINGVWGNTSHFQTKIDTTPPAFFAPTIDILKDNLNSKKYLLSFVTTDSLSSINHYEIGVLNKNEANISSPIFVQSESPYLISNIANDMHVLIRAFDNAGNMREIPLDLYPGVTIIMALKKYALYLFIILTFLLILELILHYLFGHHILDHIRRMFQIFKKISDEDKQLEGEVKNIDQDVPKPPIYN